jgi:DNA-binding transcriptional ArsR family regulator
MKIDSRKIARIFKVLSVETRVKILSLLRGRSLCVGALAMQLNISQAAVSQHLRILSDAGLLISEKRGLYVHYCLNEKALGECHDTVTKLLGSTEGDDTNGCQRRCRKNPLRAQ